MFVGLLAFLVGLWLVNTAPVFNLPLAPELVALAVACAMASRYFVIGARSDAQGLSRRPTQFLKAGAILFSLHILTLVVRGGFANSGFSELCGTMPGTAQKLECLFQAGVDQNSAVRTLGYDLAAAALFVGAFLLSFTADARAMPAAIATTGAMFSIVSLGAKAVGKESLLPDFLLTNEFGAHFQTYLMQNPTWIWPYLFPAMCCLYWTLARKSGAVLKIVSAFALVAVCLTCLYAQRRGGAILVLAVLAFVLASAAPNAIGRYIGDSALRRVLVFGGAFVVVALALTAGLYALGHWHVGGDLSERFANISIVDVSRERIWSSGLEGIKEKLFFGHGYASWHTDFGLLSQRLRGGKILDTAHNYFVQQLFELGLVQTLLIVIAFACLIVSSGIRAPDKWAHLRVLALAACGYLVITSVQEFNFVRSTYYTHALFAGWLLGAGTWAKGFGLVVEEKSRVARSLKILGTGALFIALAFVWMTSSSGYQYEANALTGYQPKVRWLKTAGTLTFVKKPRPTQGERYAVYSILKSNAPSYELWTALAGPKTKVIFQNKGKSYLPVRARSPLSAPDWIEFGKGAPEMGRTLATLVFWPPIESRLPLQWETNLSGWEPDSQGELSRSCAAACAFQLAACPKSAARTLELEPQASQSGVTPTSVTVDMNFDPERELASPARTTVDLAGDPAARSILIPNGAYVRLGIIGSGSVRLANPYCEAAKGATP